MDEGDDKWLNSYDGQSLVPQPTESGKLPRLKASTPIAMKDNAPFGLVLRYTTKHALFEGVRSATVSMECDGGPKHVPLGYRENNSWGLDLTLEVDDILIQSELRELICKDAKAFELKFVFMKSAQYAAQELPSFEVIVPITLK